MKRKRNYPRGSPKDILTRLRRSEREVQQLLNDIRYANEHNPNLKDEPFDIGCYLVRLKTYREVIAHVKAEIAKGAIALPLDILKPLSEKW